MAHICAISWKAVKGASSSDDDDATDVSDEHDDDEFDDDDGAKKPSANEQGNDVIGAVGYDCEGGGCGERVAPPFIVLHARAGGQGGRFNHRRQADAHRELWSLPP